MPKADAELIALSAPPPASPSLTSIAMVQRWKALIEQIDAKGVSDDAVKRIGAETEAETLTEHTAPAPRPSDIKTMQVRVNRAGWLEMTGLAQDLDVPLEALMCEAFDDVLTTHGKPPVIERPRPVK